MKIKREDLEQLVVALEQSQPGPQTSPAWLLGRKLLSEEDKREACLAHAAGLDCPWSLP